MIFLRIKVSLKTKPKSRLPFNYQYYLASAIYNIINTGDKELAERLHKYRGFKFFTFSQLRIPKRKIYNKYIEISDGYCHFYVSSPNYEFIHAFIDGIISKQNIRIERINFNVNNISILEPPNKIKTLKTLSPIYLKTKREIDGKVKDYDLLPCDSKFYENLKANLKKKYEAFYGVECDLDFDLKILKYKNKRILIKNTYHRCSEMVFEVWGDEELIRFGYECGFGEKNSLGFGMVGEVERKW